MTSLNFSAEFVELVSIDGQDAVEIHHPYFFARIFLQGAHLTEFSPRESDNWLWLSPTARYASGTAIRGGIPICWPWFGDPAKNPPEVAQRIARPKPHGFARTQPWTLEAAHSSPEHVEVSMTLEAHSLDENLGDWPLEARVTFHFTSDSCEVSLETRNTADQPVAFTEALHTYIPTSNIDQTTVSGFDGVRYTDTLDQWRDAIQSGPIRFNGEVDRIYHGSGDIQIERPEGSMCLVSQGSESTVVWNPGPVKAARLPDFPDTAWASMLCVETANATPASIRLIGGETHTTRLVLSKQPIPL